MCELLKSWRNSGIALGEQRSIKLAQKLISEGRQNELLAAMTSTESLEALFNKEFNNK